MAITTEFNDNQEAAIELILSTLLSLRNKKVVQRDALTDIQDSDILPIVRGLNSNRINWGVLKTALNASVVNASFASLTGAPTDNTPLVNYIAQEIANNPSVDVLTTLLAGLVTTNNSDVQAADTLIVGIGKLQAQLSDLANVYLPLAGGTMTGLLTLSGDPVQNLEAATKQYVDNFLQGLKWKESARVATTANITLTGLQTIDDITVVAGDRVLVKNQTNASENGIRIAAVGAWTRSLDADTGTELESATIHVSEGTANSDKTYTQTSDNVTLGVTSIVWVEISGAVSLPTTTKGDLIAFDSATNVRLPVGATNGQSLRVNSATSTGLEYGLILNTFTQLADGGAVDVVAGDHDLIARQIALTSDMTALTFSNADNLKFAKLIITSGAARSVDFGSGHLFDGSNFEETSFQIRAGEKVTVTGWYDGTNWNWTLHREDSPFSEAWPGNSTVQLKRNRNYQSTNVDNTTLNVLLDRSAGNAPVNFKIFTAKFNIINGGQVTFSADFASSDDGASSAPSITENGLYKVFGYYDESDNKVLITVPALAITEDTTAPLLVSAEVGNVDSTSLILTYNEALDTGSVPAVGDYSVNDGAANAVTNVAVSGNTVDLTLTNAVDAGDSVTVSYTAGVNPIRDTATIPNNAANLTNQVVTNNVGSTNQPPVASNVAATKEESSAVLIDDSFSGTTIDDGTWTVVNPNAADVTITQNNNLILTDVATAAAQTFLTNRLESIITVQSGAVKATLDYSASTAAKAGMGFFVDTNNYCAAYLKTSAPNTYVVEIIQGGISQYSFESAITEPKGIKIYYAPNNDISFWYFNTGTSAWVQIGATQNVDIGTNKKVVLSTEGTTGGAHTLTVSDLALSEEDFDTASPTFTFLFTGSYTWSDPDAGDTEGATSFRWLLADDASGTNAAAISGATSQTYQSTNDQNLKYIAFEVTPRDNSGLAGTAVLSAYEQIDLTQFWFRLSTGSNEAISIGDDIKRISGNANWNGGGSTIEALADGADGHVLWQINNLKNQVTGFSNQNPSEPYALADVNFGLYALASGTIRIIESGSNRGDHGSFSIGDWFRVRFAAAENSGRAIYEHSTDYNPDTETGNWTNAYNSLVARPTGQLFGMTRINSANGLVSNAKLFGTIEATT